MGYGDSLGLTLPTVGVTAGLTAAGLVNIALQAVIDRLETRVTPSGMDIDADLSFQSGADYFGAVDLHRVALADGSVLSAVTYPGALYRVGGDLYFNDDAGNAVRLVSAGAIDTGTAGGITGAGYGSAGVEVNWDSANTKYKFKSGSDSDAYAALEADDVLLRDGSGNAIRLGAPALAADYTMTLPAAVPGSTQVLQMSSAGAVTASNTIVENLTMAADKHVTVSGLGAYKHGSKTSVIAAASGAVSGAVAGWQWLSCGAANPLRWELAAGGADYEVSYPVQLDVNCRILTVKAYIRDTAAENAITMKLYKVATGTGVATQLGSTQTSDASGNYQTLAITGLTETVIDTNEYYICIQSDANAPAHHWSLGGIVTYDRP